MRVEAEKANSLDLAENASSLASPWFSVLRDPASCNRGPIKFQPELWAPRASTTNASRQPNRFTVFLQLACRSDETLVYNRSGFSWVDTKTHTT